MDKNLTFGDWLIMNPSGFDHHNPQNTIDDFCGWMDDTIEAVERDLHLK